MDSLKDNSSALQEGAFHNFIFCFLTPSEFSADNPRPTKWNQAIEHFFALYFLNEDGTFKSPTLAPPIFETMLYLIRGSTLYDGYLLQSHYNGDLYLSVPLTYHSFPR